MGTIIQAARLFSHVPTWSIPRNANICKGTFLHICENVIKGQFLRKCQPKVNVVNFKFYILENSFQMTPIIYLEQVLKVDNSKNT